MSAYQVLNNDTKPGKPVFNFKGKDYFPDDEFTLPDNFTEAMDGWEGNGTRFVETFKQRDDTKKEEEWENSFRFVVLPVRAVEGSQSDYVAPTQRAKASRKAKETA